MLDPLEMARKVIDGNSFMTLATADAAGDPWASPVWFSHIDHREFLWISRPARVHSQNIAARPRTSLVIFDSTCVPGEGEAVYATGDAAESTDPDHIAAYCERSIAQGLVEITLEMISGEGPFRLFHLAADQLWVLDDGDDRVPVEREPRGR